MSLTKKDLANNISTKLGLSQKDSLFFVQHFFKMLVDNKTSNININRFVTFSYKKTPKRIGRNPKTKEQFLIKKRKSISFISSKNLEKIINQ